MWPMVISDLFNKKFSLGGKFTVCVKCDYCIVGKFFGGALLTFFAVSIPLQGSGWTQRADTRWQQGQHHHIHPNPRQAAGWIRQQATSWPGRWAPDKQAPERCVPSHEFKGLKERKNSPNEYFSIDQLFFLSIPCVDPVCLLLIWYLVVTFGSLSLV